jgi:hypothetical protein
VSQRQRKYIQQNNSRKLPKSQEGNAHPGILSLEEPNRHDKNINIPQHIIVKTISTESKERILKSVREKNQITSKVKPIKTVDFSIVNLKTRKAWREAFWELKVNNFNPRTLCLAMLSFKIEGGIKIFHDKQKVK